MCRFYCCLAAHQRTRKKDSAEPSFPILWTPPHPPGVSAAAGHIGCRGLCQFRIPVSGAFVTPQLRILCSYLCSGCDRSRFSRVVGLISFVFHYWGRGCSCLRLRGVGLSSFVGFALTANGSSIWRMKGRETESYRSISNMV